MHQQTLDRLNGVLIDHLGRNRFGGPLYFWARSRDIRIPVRQQEDCIKVNGVYRFEPRYAWEPEIDRDCWVLAAWVEPVPLGVWRASFGTTVAWPAQGLNHVSDIVLNPGIEPDDGITNDVIGKVKAFRRLNERQIWDYSQEKTERIEREQAKPIGDYVRDKAVNHLPGICGPVSYPGKAAEITPVKDLLCPES